MPSSRAAMTRVSLTTSASPGSQEIGQVGDAGVRQRAVGADDEHPRAVARRRGLERDPLRREFEIEGVDAHRRLGLSFPHLRDVGGENSRPTPLSDQLFGRKTVHHQNANRRKDHTAQIPAPARQLKVALTILSGSRTGSPRLILSTFSMPDDDLAPDRVLAVEEAGVVEADEELRIGRVRTRRAGHRHRAAHMRLGVELRLEVRIFRSARAGPVRAAGLGHEAVDHPVKDDRRRRSPRRPAS